jgi:hypothetical protein
MRSVVFLSLISPLLFTGCGAEEEQFNLLEENENPPSLDTLAGTEWIYEQILPGGEVRANPGTRVRFTGEDGALLANYNVSSLGDMYDFACERRSRDVLCTQIMDKDFVYNTWASFVVQDTACDTEADAACALAQIKEISPNTPDEVINEGIASANTDMESMRSASNTSVWDQFQMRHNYLGNKLQFFFFVEVSRTGDLKIIDMYRTFHNGAWQEDSNPVGRSTFLPATEEYFWGDCEDYALLSRAESEFPSLNSQPSNCLMGAGCNFGLATDVNYLYVGNGPSDVEAADGCTYTYETAASGVVVGGTQTAEIVTEGSNSYVKWSASHAFDEAGVHPFAMVMHTTCPDAEPVELTTCTAVNVQ